MQKKSSTKIELCPNFEPRVTGLGQTQLSSQRKSLSKADAAAKGPAWKGRLEREDDFALMDRSPRSLWT